MRARNPIPLFKKWYREAEAAGTLLPEAMALATATRKGAPSVRMVLHRGFSRGGFVFYTNYNSRKAVELLENPRAAFVFHWPLIERQVRGEGRVEKLSRRESDRYFQRRPRESRLSAWASPQSAEVSSRRVSRGRIRARRGALQREEHSLSAVLGWLPNCGKLYRVLAGTTPSPSRSLCFSTKRKFLDESPARTVEKSCKPHDRVSNCPWAVVINR